MRRIAAVYTGVALVKPFSDLLREELPDFKVMNILDDSLITDIIDEGHLTPAVRRRLYSYYDAAVSAGAELIINTCSSIGEAVYLAREFIPVPLVRIDEAMARIAVAESERIGVLATLSTTLEPTNVLVKRCAAEAGKSITIVSAVAEGAFASISAGNTSEHDRLVAEAASVLAKDCDVILLAQASMARMEEPLHKLTGKKVYSSPKPAIKMVKSILGIAS